MKNTVFKISVYFLIVIWGALGIGKATLGAVSSAARGRILIQVESHGEAWYMNPENGMKYSLGRPADALNVMRALGLGITNTNLAKIPAAGSGEQGNYAIRRRLAGRILLQVEERGQAWYVHPVNLERYALGRPTDALRAMRELGLGITNRNLNQIRTDTVPDNQSARVSPSPSLNLNPLRVLTPVLGAPPNRNQALDILVYIDTNTYPDTDEFNGYADLTENDARRVLALAGRLLYEKSGIRIIIREIRSMSFAPYVIVNDLHGMPASSLYEWGKQLIETESSPPETILIFSKMGWVYGGFAGATLPVVNTSSSYCNEFEQVINSPGQRSAGLVIIDWRHWYAPCGYDHSRFPGTRRISTSPTASEYGTECLGDSCVLRADERYWQCQTTLGLPYSDPDFNTAANIIHEIAHTLDRESFGHYGTPNCNTAMNRIVGYYGGSQITSDYLRASEESFAMCPKTTQRLATRFKGCSQSETPAPFTTPIPPSARTNLTPFPETSSR